MSIGPISFQQTIASIGPLAPGPFALPHQQADTHIPRPIERCPDGPIPFARYPDAPARHTCRPCQDQGTPTDHAAARIGDVNARPEEIVRQHVETLYRITVPVPAGVTIDVFV